jgi:signal peptidase I
MTRFRTLQRLGRAVALGLLAAVAARLLLFTSYRVSGSSMREALQDGDHILVCEPGWLGPTSVGDAVIAQVEDEVLVKRIAAGPGDRIGMSAGRVLRNGEPVPESVPPALETADSFPELALGPDEYFLLGDNRRVSVDSRDFGPVHAAQLLGRVVLRFHGGAVSTVAALERAPR